MADGSNAVLSSASLRRARHERVAAVHRGQASGSLPELASDLSQARRPRDSSGGGFLQSITKVLGWGGEQKQQPQQQSQEQKRQHQHQHQTQQHQSQNEDTQRQGSPETPHPKKSIQASSAPAYAYPHYLGETPMITRIRNRGVIARKPPSRLGESDRSRYQGISFLLNENENENENDGNKSDIRIQKAVPFAFQQKSDELWPSARKRKSTTPEVEDDKELSIINAYEAALKQKLQQELQERNISFDQFLKKEDITMNSINGSGSDTQLFLGIPASTPETSRHSPLRDEVAPHAVTSEEASSLIPNGSKEKDTNKQATLKRQAFSPSNSPSSSPAVRPASKKTKLEETVKQDEQKLVQSSPKSLEEKSNTSRSDREETIKRLEMFLEDSRPRKAASPRKRAIPLIPLKIGPAVKLDDISEDRKRKAGFFSADFEYSDDEDAQPSPKKKAKKGVHENFDDLIQPQKLHEFASSQDFSLPPKNFRRKSLQKVDTSMFETRPENTPDSKSGDKDAAKPPREPAHNDVKSSNNINVDIPPVSESHLGNAPSANNDAQDLKRTSDTQAQTQTAKPLFSGISGTDKDDKKAEKPESAPPNDKMNAPLFGGPAKFVFGAKPDAAVSGGSVNTEKKDDDKKEGSSVSQIPFTFGRASSNPDKPASSLAAEEAGSAVSSASEAFNSAPSTAGFSSIFSKNSSKPFSFGASSFGGSTESKEVKPIFSGFGSGNTNDTTNSSTGGWASSMPTSDLAKKDFQQPAVSEEGKGDSEENKGKASIFAQPTNKTTFTFGQKADKVDAPKSLFGQQVEKPNSLSLGPAVEKTESSLFGAPANKPSFSFGAAAKTSMPNKESTEPETSSSTSGFSLAAPAKPEGGSFKFGQTGVAKPSLSFDGTSKDSADKPAAISIFGKSDSSTSLFGQPAKLEVPSLSIGANSEVTKPSEFSLGSSNFTGSNGDGQKRNISELESGSKRRKDSDSKPFSFGAPGNTAAVPTGSSEVTKPLFGSNSTGGTAFGASSTNLFGSAAPANASANAPANAPTNGLFAPKGTSGGIFGGSGFSGTGGTSNVGNIFGASSSGAQGLASSSTNSGAANAGNLFGSSSLGSQALGGSAATGGTKGSGNLFGSAFTGSNNAATANGNSIPSFGGAFGSNGTTGSAFAAPGNTNGPTVPTSSFSLNKPSFSFGSSASTDPSKVFGQHKETPSAGATPPPTTAPFNQLQQPNAATAFAPAAGNLFQPSLNPAPSGGNMFAPPPATAGAAPGRRVIPLPRRRGR